MSASSLLGEESAATSSFWGSDENNRDPLLGLGVSSPLSAAAEAVIEYVAPSYRPRTTSRVGKSCRFSVVGLALFVGTVSFLVHQERKAVQTSRFYSQALRDVVEMNLNNDEDEDDEGDESESSRNTSSGRLVHVVGNATSNVILQDETFGVTATSPLLKLRRVVEMYQWEESDGFKANGEYTYTLEWDANLVDSKEDFANPDNHMNPTSMPFEEQKFEASNVMLVGSSNTKKETERADVNVKSLQLSAGLVHKLNAFQQVPSSSSSPLLEISLNDISDQSLRARTSLVDQFIYVRAAAQTEDGSNDNMNTRDPSQTPQLGDLRIQYRVVQSQMLSVIARQTNHDGHVLLSNSTCKDKLAVVELGIHSAQSMLQKAAKGERPHMSWIRGACLVLIYVGLLVLSKPLSVLQDALPFVSDLVGNKYHLGIAMLRFFPLAVMVTWTTIALCWIGYHTILSVIVLSVQGLAIYYVGRHLEWWDGLALSSSILSWSSSRRYQPVAPVMDDHFMELKDVV